MNNRDGKKALQQQNDERKEHDQYAMGDGTRIGDARVRYIRYKTLHYLLRFPQLNKHE
jgi:hypothetical protein